VGADGILLVGFRLQGFKFQGFKVRVSGYLGVFDGVFWFFHRLCGIFFVTLQDIRAKAEPSLTEKVKKNENNAIAFFKLRNLKT
jgi:hypothetical protein